VNAVRRNSDSMRKPVLAQPCRLQKLVLENVSWMGVPELSHISISVIIDDLDIVRLALGPSKADTPLIVDFERSIGPRDPP
jgi:hypothetical protein